MARLAIYSNQHYQNKSEIDAIDKSSLSDQFIAWSVEDSQAFMFFSANQSWQSDGSVKPFFFVEDTYDLGANNAIEITDPEKSIILQDERFIVGDVVLDQATLNLMDSVGVDTSDYIDTPVVAEKNFRGSAIDELSMNALVNPQNGDYVFRTDLGVIFDYNGSSWVNTGSTYIDSPLYPFPPLAQAPLVSPIIQSGQAQASSNGEGYITTSNNTWVKFAVFNGQNQSFEIPLQYINNTINFGTSETPSSNPHLEFQWVVMWQIFLTSNNIIKIIRKKGATNVSINLQRTDVLKVRFKDNKIEVLRNNVVISESDVLVSPIDVFISAKLKNSIIPIPINGSVDVETSLGTATSETVNISYVSQKHIEFDGFNDYINFGSGSNISNVLDFSSDWSVSFELREDLNTTSNSCIFANGENYLGIESVPSSFYNLAYIWIGNGSQTVRSFIYIVGSGARSIFKNGDRVTFSYESSSGNMFIYVNSNKIKTLNISSMSNGTLGNKYFGGAPLSVSNFNYLKANVDHLFVSDIVLDEHHISQAISNANLADSDFYANVVGWWNLGEDDFPNVLDIKGNTNGQFVNGSPENFKIN